MIIILAFVHEQFGTTTSVILACMLIFDKKHKLGIGYIDGVWWIKEIDWVDAWVK